MARIRTIKPEFFTSLTVSDLTATARLTFIGLWTHVDDEGRCVDEPRLIAAALWPLDDNVGAATVDGHLEDLERLGLIVRYQVDGRAYLAVCGWNEHQRISRATASKHPAPDSADPDPAEPPEEGSPHTHGGLIEDSAQEGNREQGREQGETVADATDPPDDDHDAADARFDDHFWPTYPDRQGRKRGKPAARRAWHRLDIDQQRRAVLGARHLATTDEFPKDPERFLKPTAGHYPFDDYQTPPNPDQSRGPTGAKPAFGDPDADQAAERHRRHLESIADLGRPA